jgi:hypothetical protein
MNGHGFTLAWVHAERLLLDNGDRTARRADEYGGLCGIIKPMGWALG